MNSNYVFLDFEYNSSSEPTINLICCSLECDGEIHEFWLHDNRTGHKELKKFLYTRRLTHTFVAYAVTAEARSMLALDLPVLEFKFIDLFLEYRHLLNKNNSLAYGKQLIKGMKKTTKPPKNKWKRTEEEDMKATFSQPEYNLAAACYNLLGIQIDTVFKNETRDLIISAPEGFTAEEREIIQQYCTLDIKYLPELLRAMLAEYRKLKVPKVSLLNGIAVRAEFAVRTAMMEELGYPIGREALKAFADRVPELIWVLQKEINELFPQYQMFKMNPSTKQFSIKEDNVRAMLKDNLSTYQKKNWSITKGGKVSLSSKAFEKFFKFDHGFPKDNPIAQFIRFIKFRKQLNGFLPAKKGKKTFWDSVGDDGRVRPYFGIYGSQSARCQPSATGFLFLKSSWMRALCVPPKGKCIIAIDYGSQEFLISALVSKDINMINAYLSGDPYLAFAKLAGAVPEDGTKETHAKERNLFKSTTLGLSYGMKGKGLSAKLTADMGEDVSETEANKLIRAFDRAFPKYAKYKQAVERKYTTDGFLSLPDDWYMWGDNDNSLSIRNFPIQGRGSTILRRAIALCQDRGLNVIFPLHDALYIEADLKHRHRDITILANCMYEAFQSIFEGKWRELAQIKLEADVWSPELTNSKFDLVFDYASLEVTQKDIYIDPRSKEEYERFKPYFEPLSEEDYEI